MKILVISSYLPYPLYSGGNIRLFNLIINLQKEHEITLICEKRNSQTQKDIDEVSKICRKVIVFDRPKVWSPGNILKAIFSLNSILLISHTYKKFTEIIADELKTGNFDLIHVETFYVMQNLPAGKAGLPKTNTPVVLAEHNVEYIVYERYAKNAPLYLRPAIYFDMLKLRRAEKRSWKKANKVIAVSKEEIKIIGENTELVPNGVNIEKFEMKKSLNKEKKTVLFIGNFKWIQNRDSSVYIIKNIWPNIVSKTKNSKVRLWIVGKNIPDSIKCLQTESIIFDENAPDETELIFQKADVLLAPIRVGGGTSFKILESMATGTPVITSPLGNEGINAADGAQIIIAKNPAEFARKTIALLEDDYLYEKISRNGRKFIEENYDWKKIAKKLDKIYKDVAIGL